MKQANSRKRVRQVVVTVVAVLLLGPLVVPLFSPWSAINCRNQDINIKTGQVVVWVTLERSTPYVLCFLDQLLRCYRRGPMVIITDNISTRTGPAADAWLAKHPRVRFVFTPKHGSWLNQVEIWFGILTSQALRHRSFANVAHLTRAIYQFSRHWNHALAHPFEWTYTGKVLAA